jgi:small subunit ribosomal protein S10
MKFRIFLKSFENELIDFASQQLYRTLVQNEAKVKGIVSLPIRIKRFCVLRSPHIDKDSREHFELRLYKRFIDLETESATIFDFLFQTELPPGVSCTLRILPK